MDVCRRKEKQVKVLEYLNVSKSQWLPRLLVGGCVGEMEKKDTSVKVKVATNHIH